MKNPKLFLLETSYARESKSARQEMSRKQLEHILRIYVKNCPVDHVVNAVRKGEIYVESMGQRLARCGFSYSREFVALTIGQSKVGCDVEVCRTPNMRIAKRFFHKDERKFISARKTGDLENRFWTIWTRKESLVKALGEGLTGSIAKYNTCGSVQVRDLEYQFSTYVAGRIVASICYVGPQIALPEKEVTWLREKVAGEINAPCWDFEEILNTKSIVYQSNLYVFDQDVVGKI